MSDKDFIAEARRRTPTARINTGTGKLLEESLQRLAAVTEQRDRLVDAILSTQASEYTRHIHDLAASIKAHTPAQDKPTLPCQSPAS